MMLRLFGIFCLGWIGMVVPCLADETKTEVETVDDYSSLEGIGDLDSSDHPPLEDAASAKDQAPFPEDVSLSNQESFNQAPEPHNQESLDQNSLSEAPPSLEGLDSSSDAASISDEASLEKEEGKEGEALDENDNDSEEPKAPDTEKNSSREKNSSVKEKPDLREKEPENDYDFGMLSVGMEMGLGFGSSSVTNPMAGITSYTSYSSKQGSLGMRLSWDYLLRNDWLVGATAAIRYYLGSSKGNIDSLMPLFSTSYKNNQMQRYELSGKFGKTIGTLNPYIKAGALLGTFSTQYTVAGFSSSKREHAWGGTIGVGLDTDISEGISIGGLMEYDHYMEMKGSLINGSGAVGSRYKVTPSMLNAMLILKFNVDRW